MTTTTERSPDDLLTVNEAAEYLRVSVGTIRSWADDGKLSSSRTPGGHRRFRRADLDAALT